MRIIKLDGVALLVATPPKGKILPIRQNPCNFLTNAMMQFENFQA